MQLLQRAEKNQKMLLYVTLNNKIGYIIEKTSENDYVVTHTDLGLREKMKPQKLRKFVTDVILNKNDFYPSDLEWNLKSI